MRLFVTGASGFIGTAVCLAAIQRGHQVLGLQRRPEAMLPEGCEALVGHLENLPWLQIEKFSPDAVLHLAWTATPGINFHSPENESFVLQSDALFQGLATRGVRHLAGAGTFIEYATSEQPLVEDISPLAPLYPYSRAKVRALENLKSCAESAGLAWSWFRVFNAFGRGEARSRLITATMLALAKGQPAALKTPDSVRDFIDVMDVAQGMICSLEQGLTGPVNVGCGKGTRVFDLACEIAEVVGVDRSLVQRPDSSASDTMPAAIADNSKLRSAGWAPQITLREGIQGLWDTLRSEVRESQGGATRRNVP